MSENDCRDYYKWRFRTITLELLDAELTIDMLSGGISIPRALTEAEVKIVTKWMQRQLARAG